MLEIRRHDNSHFVVSLGILLLSTLKLNVEQHETCSSTNRLF